MVTAKNSACTCTCVGQRGQQKKVRQQFNFTLTTNLQKYPKHTDISTECFVMWNIKKYYEMNMN